jgi:acyl-CoA reductase-like NAD-dependent aldehyde dehydrogenase
MYKQQQLYLNGTWHDRSDRFEVHNPWNGELVGSVAVATDDDVHTAIGAAHNALLTGLAPHRRADVLDAVRQIIERRAEEFAGSISAEAGKPITGARQEVARALTTFRLSAEEARRLPGEAVQLDGFAVGEGLMAFTIPEPLGVVGAITPFNFPLNLVAHKVGPAIAAGCPVVLKPSERAPLTAGLLAEAFAEAGLERGWFNLVTGDPRKIVPILQRDDRVAVLTFTGSSAVGWELKAGSPKKHHVLELGSNTGMVVDQDADLDAAVGALVSSGFSYSGQACVSLQRLFVHEAVVADFLTRAVEAVSGLAVGDPSDEATVVGPLISPEATARVRQWLSDAVSEGARIIVGGELRDGVLEPTLVTDVNEASPLLCEEVFGPVVTVVPVKNAADGMAAVNDSRFGLNAAIFTNDLGNALAYARNSQVGSVLVNLAPSYRADQMPYGGVKDSGQGREGVKYAIASLCAQKLVVFGATPASTAGNRK